MQKIVAFMESTWSHVDVNGSLSKDSCENLRFYCSSYFTWKQLWHISKSESWYLTNFVDIKYGNLLNYLLIVWKCKDFSATQILREINIGWFRNSKTTVLTMLEALIYYFQYITALTKLTNTKIQRYWNNQSCRFRDFKLTKLDFT